MPKKKEKKERAKKPMEKHRSKTFHAGATAERGAFKDFFEYKREQGYNYISIRRLKRFASTRVSRFKKIAGGL